MFGTQLDGKALGQIWAGGCSNLQLNSKIVDDLNVFPIPDGDTGNNMSMTMAGAVNAVSDKEIPSVSEFMKAFSKGALLGARGNSGVILSQFIKGFALGAAGKDVVDIDGFTECMRAGVEKAYASVVVPTEGTILTVMREGCEYAEENKGKFDTFAEYFKAVNARMDESLEHTPELLAILKESGVVDSGGAGFIYVFRGMESIINGEKIEAAASAAAPSGHMGYFDADSVLEYGYCTEFILQLQNAKVNPASFDIQQIIGFLEQMGDSIVCVKDEDLVKVHVHTFKPGDVLNYCQMFGEYITLKIENMSVQHNEIAMSEPEAPKPEHKEIAVIAVASGSGLKSYFTEIGVDVIVDGGQTENPSTEDFLAAFKQVDADHIIVLPCNSNIVMTAQQAADIYKESDVRVVPAKSISEGYSAISMMNLSDGDVDRVISEMEECIAHVATGLITTAIRNADYEKISVKCGHYIGMNRKEILSDSEDKLTAIKEMLMAMDDIKDREVLTIFYGEGISEEELAELENMLSENFPWIEYGYLYGGQAVYDYIFAVE